MASNRKEYQKAWLAQNPGYNTKRRNVIRDFVRQYKTDRGCSRCSYNEHPAALHFHHLDPSNKTTDISAMISKITALPKIVAEIEKCIVLCANCHAVLHFTEQSGEV